MQVLVRWSAVLGLLGSSLLGPALLKGMQAIALPESEVVKRLDSVPVFTITNDKGLPVLASSRTQKGVQIATFFVSQKEAQDLLTRIKTSNAAVGKTAKVVPTSLGKAFELARKNQANKDSLVFQFIPTQQQLTSAVSLLKQNGQKVQQFNGVPLFYAVGGKEKGLLTIGSGNTKIIPFYFNQQDLQGMLTRLKQQNPELSKTTRVEVTSLAQVVDSMLKENSPAVSQMTLVPAREAIDFIRAQQPAAPKNTPAPAPK